MDSEGVTPGASAFQPPAKRKSQVIGVDSAERLKWGPELHDHFLKAVYKLGGPFATKPRDILKEMDVPGLLLTHVKSHLQKFRLTLRPTPTAGYAYPVGPMGVQPMWPAYSGSVPAAVPPVAVITSAPAAPTAAPVPASSTGDVHRPTAYYPSGFPAAAVPAVAGPGWNATGAPPSLDRMQSLASGPSGHTHIPISVALGAENNTDGTTTVAATTTAAANPLDAVIPPAQPQDLDPVKLLNRIQGLINNITSQASAPDQVSESCHQSALQQGEQPVSSPRQKPQQTPPVVADGQQAAAKGGKSGNNNKPDDEATSPDGKSSQPPSNLFLSLQSEQTGVVVAGAIAGPSEEGDDAVKVAEDKEMEAVANAAAAAWGAPSTVNASAAPPAAPVAGDATEFELLQQLLTTVNALAARFDAGQAKATAAAPALNAPGGAPTVSRPEAVQGQCVELLGMLLTAADQK